MKDVVRRPPFLRHGYYPLLVLVMLILGSTEANTQAIDMNIEELCQDNCTNYVDDSRSFISQVALYTIDEADWFLLDWLRSHIDIIVIIIIGNSIISFSSAIYVKAKLIDGSSKMRSNEIHFERRRRIGCLQETGYLVNRYDDKPATSFSAENYIMKTSPSTRIRQEESIAHTNFCIHEPCLMQKVSATFDLPNADMCQFMNGNEPTLQDPLQENMLNGSTLATSKCRMSSSIYVDFMQDEYHEDTDCKQMVDSEVHSKLNDKVLKHCDIEALPTITLKEANETCPKTILNEANDTCLKIILNETEETGGTTISSSEYIESMDSSYPNRSRSLSRENSELDSITMTSSDGISHKMTDTDDDDHFEEFRGIDEHEWVASDLIDFENDISQVRTISEMNQTKGNDVENITLNYSESLQTEDGLKTQDDGYLDVCIDQQKEIKDFHMNTEKSVEDEMTKVNFSEATNVCSELPSCSTEMIDNNNKQVSLCKVQDFDIEQGTRRLAIACLVYIYNHLYSLPHDINWTLCSINKIDIMLPRCILPPSIEISSMEILRQGHTELSSSSCDSGLEQSYGSCTASVDTCEYRELQDDCNNSNIGLTTEDKLDEVSYGKTVKEQTCMMVESLASDGEANVETNYIQGQDNAIDVKSDNELVINNYNESGELNRQSSVGHTDPCDFKVHKTVKPGKQACKELNLGDFIQERKCQDEKIDSSFNKQQCIGHTERHATLLDMTKDELKHNPAAEEKTILTVKSDETDCLDISMIADLLVGAVTGDPTRDDTTVDSGQDSMNENSLNRPDQEQSDTSLHVTRKHKKKKKKQRKKKRRCVKDSSDSDCSDEDESFRHTSAGRETNATIAPYSTDLFTGGRSVERRAETYQLKGDIDSIKMTQQNLSNLCDGGDMMIERSFKFDNKIENKANSNVSSTEKCYKKVSSKLKSPTKLKEEIDMILIEYTGCHTKQPKRERHMRKIHFCQVCHKKVSSCNCHCNANSNNMFGNTCLLEETEEIVRRELEMTDLHELAKSIDSGFASVEVLRSSILSEMEQFKNMKVDGKKKNSLKNELEKQLREKEALIKSQLSKDYMKHVCDPRHFRPEVTSHIVFPAGLQEYFQRMEQGPISQEVSMTFEWLRLASLSSYSGSGSAIQLARSGFFHDPEHGRLATRCHACNLLYTNWEYFDNVEEVHRRLSPNCPLLRDDASTTGNVSIDNLSERTAPEVAVEEAENRNSADSESQGQATAAVSDIAENLRETHIREMIPEGLSQQPTDDRNNYEYTSRSSPSTVSGHGSTPGGAVGSARSNPSAIGGYTGISQDSNNTAVGASSNVTVKSERGTTDTPSTIVQTAVTATVSEGADIIRERNQGNGSFGHSTGIAGYEQSEALAGLNDPLLVVVMNPKHSEYTTVDSRAASFTAMWPSYLDQQPRQMAEAGFFYAGVADFTRCFTCGGGLRNWEAGDDPYLEHTRWYPRCEYMNRLKGTRYVNAVIRRQEQHMAEQRQRQQQLQQQRRRQTPANTPPDPLTTPAAAVLIEIGYTRERVREAILAVRRSTGHNSVNAEQVLTWILDQDERPESTTPASRPQTSVSQPTVTTASQSSSQVTSSSSTSTQVSSTTSARSATATGASSQSSATTTTSVSRAASQSQGSTKQGQVTPGSAATGGSRSGTPTRNGKTNGGDTKSGDKTGGKDSQKKGANGQGEQASSKQKKKNGKKKGKGGGGNGNGGGDSAKKGGDDGNEGGASAMKENVSSKAASEAEEPTELDTRSLKEENQKLREMQTCKICMDNPVNMTLLPCGHLVCCETCAPHLRKCPICRKRIEGSVKTFMS